MKTGRELRKGQRAEEKKKEENKRTERSLFNRKVYLPALNAYHTL